MKRFLPFAIIAAVLLGALVGGYLFYQSKNKTQTAVMPLPAPGGGLPPREKTPGVITLEEYGDYQCPPCGRLFPILKTIKEEYGDRIKFVFHHFPLIQLHPHALAAAQAAVAAGFQGRFWEMHNLIYQNQTTWSSAADAKPYFIEYARQAGVDVSKFLNDIGSTRTNAVISADLQSGQARGVNSTPTVFIDGREIPYKDLTLDNLRQEIRNRLEGGG
ncbi:MAG: thioredoxin domain-containing protein [Blastocatellia bacterium]|nr:thioredoxin domain-containing protein [Blastocatellia bacterium]